MLNDTLPVFPDRPQHRRCGGAWCRLEGTDEPVRFVAVQMDVRVFFDDRLGMLAQVGDNEGRQAAAFQFRRPLHDGFVLRADPGDKAFALPFLSGRAHR